MDNLTLVRPEHLNHHGYLFGDAPGAVQEELILSTRVTFVRVDGDGRKEPLPATPPLCSLAGSQGP